MLKKNQGDWRKEEIAVRRKRGNRVVIWRNGKKERYRSLTARMSSKESLRLIMSNQWRFSVINLIFSVVKFKSLGNLGMEGRRLSLLCIRFRSFEGMNLIFWLNILWMLFLLFHTKNEIYFSFHLIFLSQTTSALLIDKYIHFCLLVILGIQPKYTSLFE